MTKGSDGAKIDDSSIKTKYEIDPHQKKIERERENVLVETRRIKKVLNLNKNK